MAIIQPDIIKVTRKVFGSREMEPGYRRALLAGLFSLIQRTGKKVS